jgi:hypothetical protein
MNRSNSQRSDFKPAPAGQYIAVCKGVVDLGLQDTPYGPKHKVYIVWQLPGCPITGQDKEGNPLSQLMEVGAFYTNSDNEKAKLRLMLEAWRARPFTEAELGKGIDLFAMVGRACQLTITHRPGKKDGQIFANVTAVAPLLAGMGSPSLQGEPLIYSRADNKNFDKLPRFLQGKIQSPDLSAGAEPATGVDPDDDIPF